MSYIGNTPTDQNFVAGADQFSGNGSTTAFTLSRNVNTVFDIFVAISNVPQDPYSAYSVSGNTLTFTSAPPSGTGNIYVTYRATNTQQFVPSQKSVGLSQLSATGTPSASTFLRGDNTWSLVAGFDSGTLMLFQQTAAPTGWTKQTTHNNKALRVVSGAAGSGGSVAFTTAFASQSAGGTVGSTTLTTAQMPSHAHTYTTYGSQTAGTGAYFGGSSVISNPSTASQGGGGSHDHTFTGSTINLAVQYVDLIIASKD